MAVATARIDRWERVARVPLLALGGVFIVAMSVLALGPDLPSPVLLAAFGVLVLSWVAFGLDYVVHIVLAPRGHRLSWVVHHPLQLLAVLIPTFRAVRVVDLIRQIPGLAPRSGAAVRTQIVASAFCYSVVFVYFIALSTLLVERDAPGASIRSFGDAVWWAIVTLTTVGYGDMVPVTVTGRFYAILLMLGGVIIIGVASGTAMSVIAERIRGFVAPSEASGAASAHPEHRQSTQPPRGADR